MSGQARVKNLSKVYGLQKDKGLIYFNSYGDEVLQMWIIFRTLLNKYAAKYGHEEEIIEAAMETFQSLDQWVYLHNDSKFNYRKTQIMCRQI